MAMTKRKAVPDDVSNDEVKPRAKPSARKKQAVTKTNSSAVKALIRKNATTSPLLLLPSEVRENILIHLIGDKLIHVKHLKGPDLYAADRAKNQQLNTRPSQNDRSRESLGSSMSDADSGHGDHDSNQSIAAREASLISPVADGKIPYLQPAFRHAICVANQSERSAYEEAVSGRAVVPKGESPEVCVASCKERHATCKMCGDGPMFICEEDQQALRVDMNVLGVCRQLYEESNHLLWATNTFSFDDSRTFEKFCGSLSPAQKRSLSSIHVSAQIGVYFGYTQAQRAYSDPNHWGKALKMPLLSMLRRVQTLHLCIDQTYGCVHLGISAEQAAQRIEKNLQVDMESILRLRALSVKHVTVVVSDDAGVLKNDAMSAVRWTAIKKKEYAESVRLQLTDPRGAEFVRAEFETANLARKTKIRDNAAARFKISKSVLKEKQAKVVRSAMRAGHEEARAASASQKANLLNNRSKMAVKLQEVARKRNEKAANVRDAAETAVQKEKFWREQVASAREKYKRAAFQLGTTPEELEIEDEAEILMQGLDGSDSEFWENMGAAHWDVQSEDDDSLVSSDEDDEVSS